MRSTIIAGLVKGRELLLEKTVNLVDLFIRDPCPGQQKQLRVDYTVTGFQVSKDHPCLTTNANDTY